MIGDQSQESTYVDPGFYRKLVAQSRQWLEDGAEADGAIGAECERLLIREARLLDEGRFDDWLSLYTSDCVYWVPMTPGGGDPAAEVCLAFDDRRRLEDRVYWLRTGYVWSQIPASRTRRQITNLEALTTADPNELLLRSNFSIFEMRPGRQRTLAGWYGHRVRKIDLEWKIAVKQVNLIDSDQGHENLTIIL